MIASRDEFDLGERSNGMDVLGSGSINLTSREFVTCSIEGGFHRLSEDSSKMSSAVPIKRLLVQVNVIVDINSLVSSRFCNIVSSITFFSSLSEDNSG
jgi:hypothetical protein